MSSKIKYRFKLESEDIALMLSVLEFTLNTTNNEDAKIQILTYSPPKF